MRLKKIFSIVLLSAFLATMSACSSGPSGNPEKDGKTFADEFVKCSKEKNYDGAKDLIDKYYKYYRDQDTYDVLDFFEAMEDRLETLNPDEELFDRAIEKADPREHFEDLYRDAKRKKNSNDY